MRRPFNGLFDKFTDQELERLINRILAFHHNLRAITKRLNAQQHMTKQGMNERRGLAA